VHAICAIGPANRSDDGLRTEKGHPVPKIGSGPESALLALPRAFPNIMENKYSQEGKQEEA